jgi:hypothetical protein
MIHFYNLNFCVEEQPVLDSGNEGVTSVAVVDDSRTIEYYGLTVYACSCLQIGATSTVAFASNLYQAATSPVATQRHLSTSPSARRPSGLDQVESGLNALLNPETTSTEDYTPLKPPSSRFDDLGHKPIVADRHLANYFATIHALIPVLHEPSFRALYNGFWSRLASQSGSPGMESNVRKITAPLVYSVLALGALYEDGYNDHAFWAKEWFAKAREGVNHVVEECCFETCLAVYFLVPTAVKVRLIVGLVLATCYQAELGIQLSRDRDPYCLLHWLE